MRNVIGFHNPDEDYGFLSNWYLSNFVVDGINFSSMEQYKASVLSGQFAANGFWEMERIQKKMKMEFMK